MELREINVLAVTECVAELCIIANKKLPNDIEKSILNAKNNETEPLAKSIMCDICQNLEVAHSAGLPICQDTGMAVVFLEIGQDVHFTGGDLYTAVNDGVKKGYENGLLRKSVVSDPLNRNNTGDNTPAVIHTKIVGGNRVKITVAPKGFGSENMSAVKMLTPHDAEQGVIDFVVEVVKKAGANPCPPIVVGVGIGGDFEQCALLAKQALCGVENSPKSEYYKALEQKLLSEINKLGIGPQGFGGKTTALAVNIEYAPTHIAGLPVAVNIGCHVTRHASKII
ncbi:MAG: fumarate hydratase [Clostridia bacterium]|nr:fumarate hydratase [Clostridia bacterium]